MISSSTSHEPAVNVWESIDITWTSLPWIMLLKLRAQIMCLLWLVVIGWWRSSRSEKTKICVCAPHREGGLSSFCKFLPRPSASSPGVWGLYQKPSSKSSLHCHHQDHLPYYLCDKKDMRFYFTHDPRLEGSLGKTRKGWPKEGVADIAA